VESWLARWQCAAKDPIERSPEPLVWEYFGTEILRCTGSAFASG
jgi:hypothetical protein